MSRFLRSELLMKAAGVEIVTSLLEENANTLAPGKMILKMGKINGASDRYCGFHLTKSKWDPYPWVGYVENNSPADMAGLRAGDCLLSVDDIDLLGLRIKDIATLIRNEKGARDINFSVWRFPHQKEKQSDIGLALKGPLPDVARNLANALLETVRVLECPICLECTVPPVSQCVYGHILCVACRSKTTRCPVCRVRLGQGRCLLADKLHKIFRDTFNASNETTDRMVAYDHCNLRDQLFGKNIKRPETPVVTKNTNDCNSLKPRQFLLTRLLLGDREKAASADNLTRVPKEAEVMSCRTTDTDNLRLLWNDRTKSASTSELSRESETRVGDLSSRINELSITNANQQSLILPQTPIWGGSTDSCVSCVQLSCPLSPYCREVTTFDSLLEHIKSHAVPQVHFYSGSARIPLPLPFGPNALYIFHRTDDIFFFKCGGGAAWMTYPVRTTCASNMWEWTLRTWDDNGMEVQLRRQVASLEDSVTLSPQHIAPIPDALSLVIINVQISERPVHDRLYM